MVEILATSTLTGFRKMFLFTNWHYKKRLTLYPHWNFDENTKKEWKL